MGEGKNDLMEAKPVFEFFQFWGECTKTQKTQLMVCVMQHYFCEYFGEKRRFGVYFNFVKNTFLALIFKKGSLSGKN